MTVFFTVTVALLCTLAADCKEKTSSSEGSGSGFWNLPNDNPLRADLEGNPGTLLGKVTDVDIDSIRRGDFSGLPDPNLDTEASRNARGTECTILVQSHQDIEGTCTTLKGGTPACVNGEYIDLNFSECG